MYHYLTRKFDEYSRENDLYPAKVHISSEQYRNLLIDIDKLTYGAGNLGPRDNKMYIHGVEVLRKQRGVVDESKPVFS